MPKYYSYKIHGYYLYYTASCVIEAMHVHASDKRLTEAGSAKFFVKENGDTTVAHSGILSQRDIRLIQNFIKKNYKEMYLAWRELSDQDFYGKEEGANPPPLFVQDNIPCKACRSSLLIFLLNLPNQLHRQNGDIECCSLVPLSRTH